VDQGVTEVRRVSKSLKKHALEFIPHWERLVA
jgi:hypothetical protein